ncbi:MAG: NADH-quinone oxidoreductase subunit NuoK [Acidobacteria bacterium]|nr:NADH-quinone oxidoreductase subunit NuoK [Acidobacteriota bacterium]MCW5971534.1 NADH-quinone oxidoreductase subunit NuoK [Blastocatellales bacterium]
MTAAVFALLQASDAGQGYLWGLFDVSTTTTKFLILSSLLFTIGVGGVLARRNIIVIFMSIELILNAVNINFIAFTRHWQMLGRISEHTGEIFTIFVITVAAAEAAIGLGIVISLYRNRETVAVDEIDLLKW